LAPAIDLGGDGLKKEKVTGDGGGLETGREWDGRDADAWGDEGGRGRGRKEAKKKKGVKNRKRQESGRTKKKKEKDQV
jgi:hypothetical protein